MQRGLKKRACSRCSSLHEPPETHGAVVSCRGQKVRFRRAPTHAVDVRGVRLLRTSHKDEARIRALPGPKDADGIVGRARGQEVGGGPVHREDGSRVLSLQNLRELPVGLSICDESRGGRAEMERRRRRTSRAASLVRGNVPHQPTNLGRSCRARCGWWRRRCKTPVAFPACRTTHPRQSKHGPGESGHKPTPRRPPPKL